jgi:simple sugar transport system permease protein
VAVDAEAATEQRAADERLRKRSLVSRLLNRPELGALAGAIIVWLYFAIQVPDLWISKVGTADYLEVSAELGILAVAVSLLMIGGEFDLSIGSMIGAASITIALLAGDPSLGGYNWPLWAAIAVAVAFSLIVGFLNGILVVKTGLPSFIITLGTFFILKGVTIGETRHLTGRTQISLTGDEPGYHSAFKLFGTEVFTDQFGAGFAVSIFWWIGFALLATWVLLRTRFGNWIFGAGGNAEAARNVGVPVKRVKVLLFMLTALAACLVATIQVVKFQGADVLRGGGKEFEAIIAAVIGGTLLTGGYGSAIGACLGALIFGMVQIGLVLQGVSSDWYLAFIGAMLIAAVLVNRYIRQLATRERL